MLATALLRLSPKIRMMVIMMVSKMMTTMLVVNADGDEWLVVTYDKGWQRVAGLSGGLDLASG